MGLPQGTASAEEALFRHVLGMVAEDEEWTTLSVGELVRTNIRRRRALFAALDRLFVEARGYIVDIKTSEAMAVWGCASSSERRKRLRRLYKVDGTGAWVPHLNIHRDARRLLEGRDRKLQTS